jgi:hypothetical protein
MKDLIQRIREYLRESSERKLMIGRMTVSRLTIFGIAAGILVAGIAGLLYMLYGKRDSALTYARTDVDAGFQYRMKQGLLSYRTNEYLFTYDGEKNALNFYELHGIDDYDASPALTIVNAGLTVQRQGLKTTVTLATGTILDMRAGTDYSAVLFQNPHGDHRIMILDKQMNTVNTLSYKGSKVVAFDFLSAGSTELLWVSTMDVEQFSEESIVRIYDCRNGGAMIHYSAPFYNQSIYQVYLSERCLFLIGTQAIVRYDREESGGFSAERDRVRVYGSTITDFMPGTESAYFIALPDAPENAENSLVRLITISQTDDLWSTVMQKYLPAPVVGAFVHKQSICIFTKENFLQYSFAGKKLNDLEQQRIPSAVYEFGDAAFLVVSDDACWRVTVEE